MIKSTALATFAVCAAGALGVGALSGLSPMKGSDTLFQITTDVITADGLAYSATLNQGLDYVGTGSGNGEGFMVSGNQTIAPMSRFLQGATNGSPNVCTTDAGGRSTPGATNAQGFVVALDAITVLGAATTAGTATCNSTGSAAGSCTAEPGFGAVYDQNVSLPFSGTTYTFNGWRDVLAVLFGGKDNTGAKNCNSELRNTLANHWGSFFENSSCGNAADGGPGKCQQIQHLFRRDNGSGTTDAFASLTGLGSVSEFVNSSGVETGIGVGTDPFCNTVQALPGVLTTDPATNRPRGNLLPGTYQDNDPIRRACLGASTVPPAHNVATEEVCGPDGTLGLLLPIVPTDFIVAQRGGTIADQYPVTPCAPTEVLAAPLTLTTSHGVGVYAIGQCPNGDDPNGGSTCLTPAASPTSAECLASKATAVAALGPNAPIFPSYVTNAAAGAQMGSCSASVPCTAGVCNIPAGLTTGFCSCNTNADCGGTSSTVCTSQSITGFTGTFNTCNAAWNPNQNASLYQPGTADGRAFNEYLWNGVTGITLDTFNREIEGSYYRIHSNMTLNSPNTTNTCQQTDATLQIGCLVQASPCSFGYAGRTALTWDTTGGTLSSTTSGIRVNQFDPAPTCVLGVERSGTTNSLGQALVGPTFIYPLARKLYLDSIIGFANVNNVNDAGVNTNAGELSLAMYEATNTNFANIVTNRGFLNIPNTNNTNSGFPYTEDFNEQMLCTPDAGTNVVSTPPSFQVTAPDASAPQETVCGNGKVEAYEDCDNGTNTVTVAGALPNGASGSSCSFTCRNTH